MIEPPRYIPRRKWDPQPEPDKCAALVMCQETLSDRQCSRKRVKGEWCRQHDPAEREARRAAKHAALVERLAQRERHEKWMQLQRKAKETAVEALRAIAAREVIDPITFARQAVAHLDDPENTPPPTL